jgi:26S proteasome regulatory subunit N10
LDNSDWTRNGDYHPDRWTSQIEAANLLAENRSERNPENGIGVISMAGKRVEVHVTLTNDLSRILNAIKAINLAGECDFITSMNIATLTLKHRQNKSQKQRIILFVGSPIRHSIEDMTTLGKKLKKYNVAVDVITFGNVDENRDLLKAFHEAVNNSNNSSILEVPVGYYLMDSLFTSALMSEGMGDFPVEDANLNVENAQNAPNGQIGSQTNNINRQGGMTQFERDINMAIQQSLEEERLKQETNQEKSRPNSNTKENVEMTPTPEDNEEDELEKARLLSMQEHQMVVRKEKEDEQKVKDELLENQDFIKDILKGIGNTDIKDEEVQEVLKKIKDEREGNDNKEKEDDKDK